MVIYEIEFALLKCYYVTIGKMKNSIKKRAIDFCEKNNLRLTEPRLQVLSIIISSKKPIKAYEILKELGRKILNPKPPTAYRAIDFWLKNNFIHRIESLNAYYKCEAGHLHSGSQYLICTDCGAVTESHICELPTKIEESVQKNNFMPLKWNLEVNGVCKKCS